MTENQLLLYRLITTWRPHTLVHGHVHHGHRSRATLPDGQHVVLVGIDHEDVESSVVPIDLTRLRDTIDHRRPDKP